MKDPGSILGCWGGYFVSHPVGLGGGVHPSGLIKHLICCQKKSLDKMEIFCVIVWVGMVTAPQDSLSLASLCLGSHVEDAGVGGSRGVQTQNILKGVFGKLV